MGIRYYKLFDLLNRRNMKKSDLRAVLSPKTVAKLSKGEYISGEAIEKICNFLECQPGDIMEITSWETTSNRGYDIYATNHINDDLSPEIELTDEVIWARSKESQITIDVETRTHTFKPINEE